MNKCQLYQMDVLSEIGDYEDIVFIFAPSNENRAMESFDEHFQNASIHSIVAIKYPGVDIPDRVLQKALPDRVHIISITDSPIDFLSSLKKLPKEFASKRIFVDISCIRIPEMFTLIKCLKTIVGISSLSILYSVPYDYVFSQEPFTSYHSYLGDLDMYELLGFGGTTTNNQDPDLYVFLGFEESLALKVVEDCKHRELKLVNNLPSFSIKYKDICALNNYQIMKQSNDALFTPADNPFETYNFLDQMIDTTNPVCIAPLSTKPIALGVCLFAIDNGFVRVVYPISKQYNQNTTINTYSTLIYQIIF